MTLEELFAMPVGMSLEEYQEHLKQEKKKSKTLYRLSVQIQECTDALEVLADEEGSDRWNKWKTKLDKLLEKQKKVNS